MCNPRRLEVRLTQEIEEEWRATVRESATTHVDVQQRLERVISLADRLGPSARLGLAEALNEGFRGWQPVAEQEGCFENELGPLQLHLDTGAAELTVVAERESVVTGTGDAEQEYHANVRDTVEVHESDTAYDDGWDGRDEETVQRRLDERAQASLERKREEAIESQTAEAREDARRRATDEARRLAEQHAQAHGEEEQQRLMEELEELLRQSSPLLHEEISALVGETLRRSVLHLVRVNGGELRRCEETEESIVIEAVL